VPSSSGGSHTVEAGGASDTFVVEPTVDLEQTSGSVGESITVTGEGFPPSQEVTIDFGGETLEDSATTSADGSLNYNLRVPAVGAGTYEVQVGDAPSQSFTVTSSFAISPSSGPPGTSVQVSGDGFEPDGEVELTIDGTEIRSVEADSDGAIRTTVEIPVMPGGSREIEASGGSGSGSATFNITPTLTIDEPNAAPGATVNVSGTGFRANESGITVRLNQTTVVSGITADSQGRWSGSFTVPNVTAGTHSIRAAGSTTTNEPTAQLEVGAGVSLSRGSGPPGTVVKASGSGARANERISIDVGDGLATAEATSNNQGVWSAEIPIPPSPRGALVIRASGASSQATETSFTVTPSLAVARANGSPGNTVPVSGQGFAANQAGIPVTFDDNIVASATANAQGSWLVNLEIPPAPKGTYFIKVTGTTPELQAPFTVVPGVFLDQAQAGPGESATVSGSGFAANETGITVKLGDATIANGIAANGDGSWSTDFAVPALPAGTYNIVASGSSTSAGSVRALPFTLSTHITLSANSGSPGATITITGRGFGANQQDISISYDGTVIATGIITDALGAFTTSLVVPPSPTGRHPIVVSGSGPGQARGSEIGFQVTPGITLSPPSGPPGMTMVVTGAGFGANEQNIQINYGDRTVLSGISAGPKGGFEESFLIPPSPAGVHNIVASGPVTALSSRPQKGFTVTPAITLSETAGNVGMAVTVAGKGFQPSTNITLTYDDLTEGKVTSDNMGSFNLEFAVPRSRSGEHQVRALGGDGSQAEKTFVVENIPPAAPTLRSPDNGGSGGLFGGFRPATRWQPVEDPSGVTYTVQIARDPEFFDIILEKQGLANPVYALEEAEALGRGKYFWRVKAIDGAANQSPFSSAFEMNSGIIPLWVVPTVVVLGLLASGGGAYAYYTRVYRPRKLAQEVPAFPEFVRITRPEITGATQPSTTGTAQQPALSAPRRALPSPFRRGGGRPTISPEEQARLKMVVDFVHSIPLLEVSPDLMWLEELVEPLGGTTEEAYEQVLRGDLEPVYQPAWTQHPTYQEMQSQMAAQPFVAGLEQYIESVNDCAADALAILRKIYGDLETGGSLETLDKYAWRFILTVGQSTMAWFRGTYLAQPSSRQYSIEVDSEAEGEPLASLYGDEKSPFSGLIVEGVKEEELVFYRDLHIHLRNTYRTNEDARALASKMTSTSAMRDQLMQAIAQLGEQSLTR
jgi:hypothetical protein